MGGGGSGGGQTQQKDQYQSISPWAQPYVTSVLGAAQRQIFNTDESGNITEIAPYTAYGIGGAGQSPEQLRAAQSSVAGFSPLQQQAFQSASELQTPGQFGQATGAAGLGTLQALGAGQQYQRQATSPYALGAYMNPYVQQSLQPQLNEIARQGNIAAQQAAGQATAAGAFGGTRSALAQNEAQRNAMLAQQQAIAQGYNTAYDKALQSMQYGANLGLQGAQTGISGAGQLGQLGTSQLAAQQGIMNLQNQYGTQQQQQNQNIINQAMQNYQTAQQYPQQQLNFLNSLITGKPITDVTTTLQQPAPNMGSQLVGAGAVASGLGSNMKKGGKVKRYNVGKEVEQDLEDLDTEALQHEAANSPSDEVRKQAAAILARDRMYQGITGLKSRLAFSDGGILNAQYGNADSDDGYAGGGIVAFASGGKSDVSTMANTDVMGNILSYMNDPRYMALAQPDEERQAILQDIKDARAKAAAAQDNFLGRALIAGGAKAMSGTSPFGMVNLGEGITSGLGQYTAEEKNMEDQLNKLRQGRLDLSKLTSEERKNLLHYATTAAGTQEQVEMRREGIKSREQLARDAAANRGLTSSIAAADRLTKEAIALGQKIYDRDVSAAAKELGTTIEGMTQDQKDELMRRSIGRANMLLRGVGRKTIDVPEDSNPTGGKGVNTVDFSKLPK